MYYDRFLMHCHCEATDRHFTLARAQKEIAQYHRRGPTGTARLMLAGIQESGVTADTMLDIGAGIGVLHHELLGRGVTRAAQVEASSAYVETARQESERRGHAARVEFAHGDFLSVAAGLPAVDLVTLDRVVCCYPELDQLVQQSAAKARKHYALSFPHDRWYVRAQTRWENASRRRAGSAFRTFVHPPSRIQSLLLAAGFSVCWSRKTLVWQILICTRIEWPGPSQRAWRRVSRFSGPP